MRKAFILSGSNFKYMNHTLEPYEFVYNPILQNALSRERSKKEKKKKKKQN